MAPKSLSSGPASWILFIQICQGTRSTAYGELNMIRYAQQGIAGSHWIWSRLPPPPRLWCSLVRVRALHGGPDEPLMDSFQKWIINQSGFLNVGTTKGISIGGSPFKWTVRSYQVLTSAKLSSLTIISVASQGYLTIDLSANGFRLTSITHHPLQPRSSAWIAALHSVPTMKKGLVTLC